MQVELAGRTIGTIVTLLHEEEGVHQGQDAYATGSVAASKS